MASSEKWRVKNGNRRDKIAGEQVLHEFFSQSWFLSLRAEDDFSANGISVAGSDTLWCCIQRLKITTSPLYFTHDTYTVANLCNLGLHSGQLFWWMVSVPCWKEPTSSSPSLCLRKPAWILKGLFEVQYTYTVGYNCIQFMYLRCTKCDLTKIAVSACTNIKLVFVLKH